MPVSRLKFLDGLRGWGAVFVLLYHVFYDGLPIGNRVEWVHFLLPLNGGNAVLVFFLVSGFSLSIGYLVKRDAFAWVKIVAGRYFRLAVPVFFACLMVHLAMVMGWLRPAAERFPLYRDLLTFDPTLGHLLSFSLFGVFFRYNEAETYIAPLWAMGPELIGSFAVLFALPLLRSVAWRIPLLLALALVLAVGGEAISLRKAEYIAIFPIGAAIAEAFRQGWLEKTSGYASSALLTVGLAAPLILPPTFLVSTVAATALMLGAIANPAVRGFLENSVSTWLGEICFPLYLVHGPVMWILGEPLMRNFGATMTGRALIDALIVIVSFGAAVAFLPANWLAVRTARTVGDAVARVVVLRRPQTA